jgi:hypothetical protein
MERCGRDENAENVDEEEHNGGWECTKGHADNVIRVMVFVVVGPIGRQR